MISVSPSMQRAGVALSVAAAAIGMAGCGPQGKGPDASNVPTAMSAAPAAVPTNAGAGTVANNAALAPQDAAPAQRVGQPVPAADPNPPARVAAPPYAPPVQTAQAQTAPQASVRAVPSAHRGEVSRIEPIHERPEGTGKGAVIGGVLGAVVGHQFGHGNGRTAMTVVGAAGGAVAGNNVERNMNTRVIGYRVSVRLDNGASRTYEESRLDGLRVGDRVRIEGRHVRRG